MQLPNVFYTMPRYANTTMETKDLKEILLSTDGWVFAQGYLFDVCSKAIGAGVHKVWLEKR